MANTLEIVIKATDKASKEIGAVTKGIDGLGKAGGAIFKTVGIAAGAAAAAVGAVGAAIVKLAVDAVPLQGIEAAFQGITEGSAEMLDALRASSNGMVRDTELMKSYNLAAQLVGKEFADKLPDAMGYLQKVAAATGQDMSYMMDSLVRGVGRMSPMILDNLGIQVTLEEATAEAAAMFGVEASELTKVQLQAGMTNVVMRALERNTATMPEVAGSAAQQWAAFNTQLANFKDRIGMGALPILQRILGTVEDAGLGGWLDKISGWFGESFVPGLLNVWDRVAQFIEDIKNGERLQTAVRKMLQGLFSEDTVQKAVDIVSFARGISTAIHNGDWSTVGTMLWGVVQSAFSRAIAAGQTIDEMLRDWISGKLGIKAELKLDPGMEGLPSDVIAGMMPNTSTWAEIGVELKNRLIEQFNVAKDRVGEWLAVGGNFAAKLFESIKLGIMDALTIAPLFERNEMGEWVDKSPWKSIGDAIGAKIGNAITTGLRAWFDFTFYGIPETIHDWVTANIEKFRSAGESIGTALASMISSGLQKAVSPTEHKEWGETIMHDIIVALTSAAASLSMDIGNIGLAIADGIAAGLTSRIDSEAWRAGLSEGLYQAIKVALETGPLGWIIRLAGGWDALQKLRDSPQGQAIDRALPFGSKASGGAASGLTLVGERGPELVNLPVGSYVHDNAESQRMMANHTYNVSVTITGNANAKDVEVGVLRGLRAAGVAV